MSTTQLLIDQQQAWTDAAGVLSIMIGILILILHFLNSSEWKEMVNNNNNQKEEQHGKN